MAIDHQNLHWLILRQLKRANLSEEDITPTKLSQWQDFLTRVNRTYYDHEQERYLLERSMETSSREMADLNEKLEYAQKIAHLGYWFYDRELDKLMWSEETFNLAGIDPAEGTPSLKEVLELIHEEDRPKLETLIQRAFTEGKDYEIELRFKNKKDGNYHWHYAKGQPHIHTEEGKENDKQIRYLSGIAIDITERKINQENIEKMHQQLLSISRQAGMAEVATSVLHNIGNILNSANVSISLLHEITDKLRVDKLLKLSEIIKEHLEKKDSYLTEDPNGKIIPNYLIALSQNMLEEKNNIVTEINNIDVHINHIKDIVALQKDISGIAGMKENIHLNEVIDLAIQMGCSSAETKDIQLIKDYQYDGSIISEKAKLLQIIVNLIRNARDSVAAFQQIPKIISITTKKSNDKPCVIVQIQDNGSGISNKNLTRIFSLGFTTKPNGHGFGLHSSAIAATELKGSLTAESEGIGKGATFILELPLVEDHVKEEMDVMIE